jgi:hypothetical protein
MPNNKTNYETSSIETKYRSCVTRTFTDPDLHARLKEEENSIKKIIFINLNPNLFRVFFPIRLFCLMRKCF